MSGNAKLLEEKLMSILSHLCDEHEFEDNTLYKECPHGTLGEDREKPWLDKDSLV